MSDERERIRVENEAKPRPILGVEFERAAGLAAALAWAVDAKGVYFPSHSKGVEQLARSIAEHMNCFRPGHIGRIANAALLHDVGKLQTPDRVLLKPAPLDPDELRVMRMHPEHGEAMLIAAGYGDESLWVRHHHSRWDGTGYPDKLKAEEIPIEARIIGVADAFHAMQSDRPYQRARPAHAALGELQERRGIQFCPVTVDAVIEMQKTR